MKKRRFGIKPKRRSFIALIYLFEHRNIKRKGALNHWVIQNAFVCIQVYVLDSIMTIVIFIQIFFYKYSK
jgi:hypothetical protein